MSHYYQQYVARNAFFKGAKLLGCLEAKLGLTKMLNNLALVWKTAELKRTFFISSDQELYYLD